MGVASVLMTDLLASAVVSTAVATAAVATNRLPQEKGKVLWGLWWDVGVGKRPFSCCGQVCWVEEWGHAGHAAVVVHSECFLCDVCEGLGCV